MKNYISILFALMLVAITSCDNDEPKDYDGTGRLIVHLTQDGADIAEESCFNYHIALTPEYGMGWFAPNFGEVDWPIDVKVGTYTIGVASPLVSESETIEYYYFGDVKNVKIVKNKTTEITIDLTLTEFPKSDLE